MAEEKVYKIIIVDDDDFLVDMYVTKFANAGVSADTCKSGGTLFEKLKSGVKPNLILLDIVIPVMNGIEILKELRKEKLADDVPIVMLTNQNDDKNLAEAKALGVSGYIVKSAATPSEVVIEVMKIIKNEK